MRNFLGMNKRRAETKRPDQVELVGFTKKLSKDAARREKTQ